jgi:arylsulfatase
MFKRTVFTLGAVTAAARLSQGFSVKMSAKDTRPNIVFILADDLGFSDLRCYGGEAATTNLDQLASAGVRFNQFYNGGKCEPTRVGLMTGHRNTKEIGFLGERAQNFMPALLRQRGYRTVMAGKWHVSQHPMDRGFDRFFGMEEGACNYYTGSGLLQLDRSLFNVPASGFYTTDAFTDYALQFLSESKTQNDQQPFFLYLAYNAPHAALQAPEEEIAKYRGNYMEGWEAFKERRFARAKALGLIPADSQMPAWPQNLPHWNELTESQKQMEDLRMATYTAMIDRMDQNIGRVMDWLKANGEWNNTLIVFASDNGANPFYGDHTDMLNAGILPGGPDSKWDLGTAWAHVCDTPFRLYKRNQHEGGICAPLIMRGPAANYAAGSISSLPVNIHDFLPTFYALASGTGRPAGIEGTDLSGLWKAGAQTRNYEMMSCLADHRYVRSNEWKLVACDFGPWELYDLSKDRTETQNLASQNPQQVADMADSWDAWYNSFSPGSFVEVPDEHMGDQGTGVLYVPYAMPTTAVTGPLVEEYFDWGPGVSNRESIVAGTNINGLVVQSGTTVAWSDASTPTGFSGSSGPGNGTYTLGGNGDQNNLLLFSYVPVSNVTATMDFVYQAKVAEGIPGAWLGFGDGSSTLLSGTATEKVYVRMNQNGNMLASVTTLNGTNIVDNVNSSVSLGGFAVGDRLIMSLSLNMADKSAVALITNVTKSVAKTLNLSWTDTAVDWKSVVISQTGGQTLAVDSLSVRRNE